MTTKHAAATPLDLAQFDGGAVWEDEMFVGNDDHIDKLKEDAAALLAECERLSADRAKLVETLRPFAEVDTADFLDCPLGKARALLRELGEAE